MGYCCKYRVTGMVQMVGFRYHTAHEGNKLGLTGYAKNLNDGSVEIVACGTQAQVEQLGEWLKQGPRTASVNTWESEPVPFTHYSDFRIL